MEKETKAYLHELIESWRSIDKLYEQYAKSQGLTYLGLSVLDIICTTPEVCTQKLICEQLFLPKQNVNLIIKSLWEQGYLEMREITSDRRNKQILLSEAGQKYAVQVFGRLNRAEELVIGQLTGDERQMLLSLVQKTESIMKTCLQQE